MIATVFGQGQVSVINYIGLSDPNNAIINDTNGSPTALQGGTFLVDLLYGTSSITQDAGLALTFHTGSGAGFFFPTAITLPGGYNGTLDFELVVWQSVAGATWAAASGGNPLNPSSSYYMTHNGTEWGEYIFTLTVNNTSPTSIAQGPGTLVSFNLVPAPEPATLALMGLGGLSLLLFRRRK
jgi:hypothetical protein